MKVLRNFATAWQCRSKKISLASCFFFKYIFFLMCVCTRSFFLFLFLPFAHDYCYYFLLLLRFLVVSVSVSESLTRLFKQNACRLSRLSPPPLLPPGGRDIGAALCAPSITLFVALSFAIIVIVISVYYCLTHIGLNKTFFSSSSSSSSS